MEELEFAMIEKIDLKYPSMREELISYLGELSDKEYQIRNWLPENSEDGIPKSSLDYSVHFLFDDTNLSLDPKKCIGFFLYNENEANVISKLIRAIDVLFKVYGDKLTDKEYICTPEWLEVMHAAATALVHLKGECHEA